MNFRPWYQRLLRNPFAFVYELVMLAYERHGLTNPTSRFGNRLVDPKLHFDAAQGRLNGIPFGATIDSLVPFGAADHALGSGEGDFSLDYASLGMSVSFEEQKLISFEISFDSHGYEHPTRFVPCRSAAIKVDEGRVWEVGYTTSPAELDRLLGEPDLVETMDYEFGLERAMFYHLPACRIVASFDARSDGLIHLDLAPRDKGRISEPVID